MAGELLTVPPGPPGYEGPRDIEWTKSVPSTHYIAVMVNETNVRKIYKAHLLNLFLS